MNKISEIKQVLTKELQDIKELKKTVEKSLKKCPEGSLVVSKSNGVIQFFQKTSTAQTKGKYLNKQKGKLISALAQKDYDKALLKELQKQEMEIEKALNLLPKENVIQVFEKQVSARKELINPHIVSDDTYRKEWETVSYVGNRYHDENLKFVTEKGELVRSKSEKIIADKLYAMGIPYRYEYPLQVAWGVVYPDFTILQVRTRKEIYLEHFGMMDNPEYCENALRKLQELASVGVVMGKNLIATFESTTVPLDTKLLGEYLEWLR